MDEVGAFTTVILQEAQKAFTLQEAVLGGTHTEVARCLNLLGVLHRLQGDFVRAEPHKDRTPRWDCLLSACGPSSGLPGQHAPLLGSQSTLACHYALHRPELLAVDDRDGASHGPKAAPYVHTQKVKNPKHRLGMEVIA